MKTPYRIYQQLRRGEYRFEDLESGLYTEQDMQNRPDEFPYSLTYSGEIEDTKAALGHISRRFNIERPEDFKGHSLSVSDIVTLGDKGFLCSGFMHETGWRELAPETLNAIGIKTGVINAEDEI